jgi:ATP-dependent RNA helicase DDX31/DBP7
MLHSKDLKRCCEKFDELETKSGCVVFHETIHTFTAGLAAFQIYRETFDVLWYNRGKRRLEEMKIWAEQGSPWNFKQKVSLLEAEEQFSSGNVIAAKESYKNAIASAKMHKYINDEAIACELAAKFYLANDEFQTSLEHFRFAHENYSKWGAVGKANHLFSFINEKFATSCLTVPNSQQINGTVNFVNQ